MRCPRCVTGLLYETICWDLMSQSDGFSSMVCITCGNVIDDIIVRNRLLPPLVSVDGKRKRRPGHKKSYIKNAMNQSLPPLRMDHLK